MNRTRSIIFLFGVAIIFPSIFIISNSVIRKTEIRIEDERAFEVSSLCSSSSSGNSADDNTKTRHPTNQGTLITECNTPKMRTLHVVQCLSGDATGFIDEWEVNLKSILMNAPSDAHLHIHIIADEKAVAATRKRLEVAHLKSTKWRNKLSLTITNVESQQKTWLTFLESILKSAFRPENERTWFDARIGIGGYFRLLAHTIILNYTTPLDDDDLRMAVYMDTDVVVMSGLNDFISAIDKVVAERGLDENGNENYPLWTWQENSGFMAMDLVNFERFWTLAKSLKQEIQEHKQPIKSDQFIMKTIQQHYTDEVGLMPGHWSVNIGHGYRANPALLFEEKKVDAGILHFTGRFDSYFSGEGILKYCRRGRDCHADDLSPGGDADKMDRTWGRADHYVKLPWDWVKYQGGLSKVRLGDDGHAISIVNRVA